MTPPRSGHSAELKRIFPGDSQMAQRMRAFDWSATELGAPRTWPQNLRSALGLCLPSPFPTVIWWGSNLNIFYNDAYIPLLGEIRHPRALGQPGRECWGEIWDAIGPMLESVRSTGRGTGMEDVAFFYTRRVPNEEVFVRFSHGPILNADGHSVDGIFTPCTETTEQVVSARRLETLRRLGLRAAEDRSIDAACREVSEVLAENRHDIPFAAIYLLDKHRTQAVLAATAGLPEAEPAFPPSISLTSGAVSPWRLRFVLRTHHPEEIDLQAQGLKLPGGPWPDLARQALVLPILAAGYETVSGFLIAGVSSRRILDTPYRTFFDLVASHISTALVDAQAHEAERRQAEALAEVDRAKTTFLSNVSHEFRAPLGLILGPLEDEMRGQPRTSERLQVAHRNSLRLLKLVNSLLDYSRIESRRIEAHYEPVDLATLTAELASNFRAAIEKAGMELEVRCPPLPESVYVDREMWERIVLNLISNAFKFTLQGRITVTQEIRGAVVELTVQDTGSGIPPEELPRIFDRFYRVKWTKARTQEGSGIGLALVQEMVKLHGGAIRVESIPDQGSTFAVSIPLGNAHLPKERIGPPSHLVTNGTIIRPYVEEAVQWGSAHPPSPAHTLEAESPLAESVTSETATLPRPRATIVWAEDNEDMRSYVQHLLQSHYEVKAVANGTEALAAVRQHRPDLVLTDIMMPDSNGFDLLRELRAEPLTQAIPVVLLSARAGEEARIEGREAGADDYMVKPFAARELLARIASNVNLARVRQESEQRIAGLVDSAMDAIISIDEDQRIVLFNKAATAMFRCSAAEAIGTPIERFIPERFREAHRRHIGRFAETGTTSRAMGRQLGVLWGLRADGEEFPIEASISQVQLDWRRQLTVILRDITERRKAEEELRESRERITGLVESAMDAIISIDEDQRIILFNRAAAAMFRCPASDAIGAPIERFIPERFRAAHRQHVHRFAEAGATSRAMGQLGALWGLRADGEEFPIEASISQMRMGGQRQLTVILRDITERQRQEQALVSATQDLKARVAEHSQLLDQRNQALEAAQQALRASKAQLSLALKAGHACTFDWEIETNETCWTDELLTLYGLRADELGGQKADWLDCLVPEDREAVQAAIEHSLGTGEFTHDFRIRRRDNGEIRWIAGQAKVIFDSAGQPLRMTGINVDITERKAEAAAIQNLNAELEQRVQERTAELERANEGMLHTNMELHQFAYATAHDLQTPLRSIAGFAQLVQREVQGRGDEQLNEWASLVIDNTKRLHTLIEDLLTYTRLDAQGLPFEAVNLRDIADEVVASLSVLIHETGAEVRSAHLPTLPVDRAQIAQVFQNLIENGIKYNRSRPPKVTVAGEFLEDEWVFSVADNGIGIDPRHHERIFEIFRRLHTYRQVQGTGIGLALCRRIVERHGGRIWVESRPGEGSTFYFTLPVRKETD